jgi:hypothetical protein
MDVIEELAEVSATVEPVPIGNKIFYIRIMSGTERDEWEQIVSDTQGSESKEKRSKLYADLLVRALGDAAGNRVLKDEQFPALQQKVNCKVLKKLFDKAFEVNRIGEAGEDGEKKDSAAAPTSDSGSPSPAPSA